MLICNVIVSPSQKRQIDIYRKGWGGGEVGAVGGFCLCHD